MRARLLVVEPSLTTRKVVELAFEDEDVELAVALTGAEALEQVRAAQPHAVLASLTLPDISGIDLCRSIHELPTARGLPVILFVGRGDECDEERARAAGVVARLRKPLDPQELVEVVERWAMEPSSAAMHGVAAAEREERAVVPSSVGESLTSPQRGDEHLSKEHGEGAPEAPEEQEAPGEEVVPVEGSALAVTEEETDFEVSLRSLSRELSTADVPRSEAAAVGEEIEAQDGRTGEAPETGPQPEAEGVAEGIMLEMASDEEIRDTLLEGEIMAATFPSAEAAPDEAAPPGTRLEVPPLAAGREQAEGDLLERLIGRRVWQFTEEVVRASLKQSLERISPEIITAVRDEVRALFPHLAERIIRDEIEKLKKGPDS